MPINSDKIKYLTGDSAILDNMPDVPVLPMFSDKAVQFLSDLSKELLKEKRAKEYVDIISYAYWVRKASLEQVKNKHKDRHFRLGRGVAFHIAPSNVPVNFAVSMTSSLLAGNPTLIRVSDKDFEQVNIITNAINELLSGEHRDMQPYICIIRYEHDDEITSYLSSICDIRIIWGGNNTIDSIRKSPLPPRAIEMTFADRFSLAVINAEKYLKEDAKSVAKGFYTDTYYTDQNACSSPRLIVWLGDNKAVQEGRKRFFEELGILVKKDYDMKPIQTIDKFSAFCDLAMTGSKIKLVSDDNYMIRAEVSELSPKLIDYKSSGGYFFEYLADKLYEILPVLAKPCQTISVLGVDKDEVLKLVVDNGVKGVDRIVDLGQTMGLEFIWDGFKMIEAMTRFVYAGEYE